MTRSEGAAEKVRVYLVDDHPTTLSGLRVLLDEPDIEIAGEARTGKGAVKEILKLEPRVVVLDIRLPDMDGLRVLRHLKPQLANTSIILFTAFEEPGYLAGAVAEGAAGFAIKTDEPAQLLALVRRTAAGEECLPRSYWAPLLRRLEEKWRAERGGARPEWPERDVQILHFMAHGKSNARIAELLELGRGTLLFHIRGIFARLGVADRTHAVVQAIARGILALPDFKE